MRRELGETSMRCLGLSAGVAAAVLSLAVTDIRAEPYPMRSITLVVPFPAGGATDVVARIVAKGLSDRIGQSVVVDNRPGANGAIGSAFVDRKSVVEGRSADLGGDRIVRK